MKKTASTSAFSSLCLMLTLALAASACESVAGSKEKAATQAQQEAPVAVMDVTPAGSKKSNYKDRKPDVEAHVATMIDGALAECMDLRFWGEVELSKQEAAAFREALVPEAAEDTLHLSQACGDAYRNASPQGVCSGITPMEKDGMRYFVEITTSHYLEVDLQLRMRECALRQGRWLAF